MELRSYEETPRIRKSRQNESPESWKLSKGNSTSIFKKVCKKKKSFYSKKSDEFSGMFKTKSIKLSGKIDPGFSIFGASGKGFSFGGSPKLRFKYDENPGPGRYSPSFTLVGNRQPGAFIKKGRSCRSGYLDNTSVSPGPGFYHPSYQAVIKHS